MTDYRRGLRDGLIPFAVVMFFVLQPAVSRWLNWVGETIIWTVFGVLCIAGFLWTHHADSPRRKSQSPL